MSIDFNSEIQAELSSLEPGAQRRVLRYVRSLKRGDAGTPGTVVADFAGAIPLDDLQLIQTAIENGCEQVDVNEW
jgi:hypothetical protein